MPSSGDGYSFLYESLLAPSRQTIVILLPKESRIRLLQVIRQQFRLDWRGIHGVPHWARVRHHGLKLAQETGADPIVVELFAFLHDSQRCDDNADPMHGQRGSDYARKLHQTCFKLTDNQLELLCLAIAEHSRGTVHSNPTIQTCWDADRLDLGRVGIYPSPEHLSWEALKYTAQAYAWSRRPT